MKKVQIYKNDNCEVFLIKAEDISGAEKTIIALEWSGFVKEKEFKNGLNTASDTAEIYRADLWLSDIRNLKSMSPDLQTWSMAEWIPKVCGKGLYRRQAFIQATDIAGKIVVHALKNKIRGQEVPVEMQEYPSQEAAISWLVS